MRRLAPFIVVLVLTSAATVQGGSAEDSAQSGDRVRLTSAELGGRRLTGDILGRDESSILFRPERGSGGIRLSWKSITQMDVSHGRHRSPVKGALIGGMILTSVYLLAPDGISIDCEHCGHRHFGDAAGMAAVGATIGGVIGMLSVSEKWEAVAMPSVHIGLVPRPDGIAAAASLRF